jgi:hypothetical protein
MTDTEVWLYGSSARGDRDHSSDVDLLVIGQGDVDWKEVELPARERLSISRYAWEEVEHMAEYGSLFLHHVREEGYPLRQAGGGRLRRLLSRMGPYARADRELACFSAVLDDVDDSTDGDCSPPFELSVIATAVRHASILGCYLIGDPSFGRTSAFRTLLPQLGYAPAFVDEVVDLYSFRRADDEGRELSNRASTEDVRLWVMRVRRIIDQVAVIADERA